MANSLLKTKFFGQRSQRHRSVHLLRKIFLPRIIFWQMIWTKSPSRSRNGSGHEVFRWKKVSEKMATLIEMSKLPLILGNGKKAPLSWVENVKIFAKIWRFELFCADFLWVIFSRLSNFLVKNNQLAHRIKETIKLLLIIVDCFHIQYQKSNYRFHKLHFGDQKWFLRSFINKTCQHYLSHLNFNCLDQTGSS